MPGVKEAKAYKGLGMEGFVARWYTKNTGKDLSEYQRHARLVAEELPEGASVLDLAPGPGFLAIELAKLGNYHVTGLDISETFVRIAAEKAKEAGVSVEFRRGNAAAMPFDDNTFDFIVCRAAFKNFADPVRALNEMHRVLMPRGKALIIDLRPDASPEAISVHVKGMGLDWFNALVTRFIFKRLLLKRAYPKEKFKDMASESNFGTCEIQDEPITLLVSLVK